MIVVVPILAVFANSTLTIKSLEDEREDLLFKAGEVGSSYYNDPEPVKTAYNIRYRSLGYQRVLTHSGISPVVHVVDYAVMGNTYGVYVLESGSITVFNRTAPSTVNGYNVSTHGITSTSIASFNIEHLVTTSTNIFYLCGYDTSDDTIGIRSFTVYPNGTISETRQTTIYNPLNFTGISQTSIEMFIFDPEPYLLVGGYYTNNSNDIPFLYKVSSDFSSIEDYILLNSSETYYQNFNDTILYTPVRESGGNVLTIITNKDILRYTYSTTTIDSREDLIEPIQYTTMDTHFTRKTGSAGSSGYQSFGYIQYDLFGTVTFDAYTVKRYQVGIEYAYNFTLNDQVPSLEMELFQEENYIGCLPDFADGIITVGFDNYFETWNDFLFDTGVTGGILDVHFPIGIGSLVGEQLIEIAFGNTKGLWIATLSIDDDGVLEIGNSRILQISSTNALITHDRGTSNFRYRVSGFMERSPNNSSELVEIGIVPIYIRPINNKYMLSTSELWEFSDITDGGIIVDQISNFISFANDLVEFNVVFETKFCPLTYTPIAGYSLLDMQISYVVYEVYSNNTYTQTLMDGYLESKSRFYDYDYELETQLVIEDSHLLDELNVFLGGVQFDPFSLVYDNASLDVVVIDKITGDDIFNETAVLFSDPFVANIPAKYEFFLKYYSNFDKFGVDFGDFNTTVNGTEVTSEFVRVLSPNALVTIADFGEEVIFNDTINKYRNGTYISIGLDVITLTVSNRFNRTMNFYLTKGDTEIFIQMPAGFSLERRVVLGTYTFRVEEVNGTLVEEDTFTMEEPRTISFGFGEEITVDLRDYGFTFVDIIVSIAMGAAVLVVLEIYINRRRYIDLQERLGYGTSRKKNKSRLRY
jgi:hypothetical protein